MRITIVLPAINEVELLLETARIVEEQLVGHEVLYTIVTSATLTTPECRSTITGLQKSHGARVTTFDQVLPGVGSALQEAFARSGGDVIVLMTSDLETPPQFVGKLIQKIEEGYDMVTATRWSEGFAMNGYALDKLILNFLYQQCVRLLYQTTLSDLTFGYRAFRADKLHAIQWEEARHPFFFETMLKPLRLGYRIAEVGTPWKSFLSRKTSVGRINHADLFVSYTRLALRVRFMPKHTLLAHV